MSRLAYSASAVPRENSASSKRWGQVWEHLAPYVFISPFFIGFLVFQVFPIGFSVFLSTQQWNPYKRGAEAFDYVGFQHFSDLLHDDRFWNSLRVTFTITIICTILGTALAVILAALMDKVPDRLSNFLRAGFFMPAVTSVVVITFIWKQLLNTDYGAFNSFLSTIGLHPLDFLGNATVAVWSIIIMLVWAGLGWDALIVTSALRAIPEEYYEAAKLDGANGLQEFFYVTLPLLRPTLLFIVTTGLIYLLGLFSQVQLLTNGNPIHKTETLALYLYDTGFGRQEFGYASALAVTLTIIMFIASYVSFRFFGGDREV